MIAIISVLLSANALGAPAFNASGSGNTTGSSTLTFSLTVNSGSNLIGTICVNSGGSSSPPTGVTWAGSAMTQIGALNGGPGATMSAWYITGISSGSTSVVVTDSSSAFLIEGVAIAFSGVVQTSPINTSTANASNPPTATINTTVANTMIFDSVAWTGSASPPTPSSGQTVVSQLGTSGTVGVLCSYRLGATATSYTDAYTVTATATAMGFLAFAPSAVATSSGAMMPFIMDSGP